jgi:hypothetical protein
VGEKIPGDHHIVAWLVEFAAVLVNRYEVGHDGKTPYERLRGKQSRLLGLEFGERLHCRRNRVPGKLAKMDVSWQDGLFLGFRSLSGEIIIGTPAGVMRTRTVQRRPVEQRWSQENLKMCGGLQWKPSPADDEGEALMPSVDMRMAEPDVEIRRPEAREEEVVRRRLYLEAKDFDAHGTTAGCKGCLSMLCRGPSIMHSEACRRRMTAEIAKTKEGQERVREVETRMREHQRQLDPGDRAKRVRVEDGKTAAGVEQSSSLGVSSSAAAASSSSSPVAVEDQAMEESVAQEDKRKQDLGWVELAERIKRARMQREDGEDVIMEIACKEDFEQECEEKENELDEYGEVKDEGKDMELEREFKDERTGKWLDPSMVRAAREEEIRGWSDESTLRWTCRSASTRMAGGRLESVGWTRTRALACTGAGWWRGTFGRSPGFMMLRGCMRQPLLHWRWSSS